MSSESVNPGLALPRLTTSATAAAGPVRVAEIVANPSRHELQVKARDVVDQGTLPCCVSTALGAAMEILNPSWPALAPLFHYYVTRFDRGGADAGGFLFLIDGLATLTRDGICRKELHPQPYTVVGASTKPSVEAYADAKRRALRRLNDHARFSPAVGSSKVVWIREQLRNECPVVLGMQMPLGYPKAFLNEKMEWLDPDKPPRTLAGHCVLVTGYDDSRQALHIQDSRGIEAFDEGRWWMGYLVVDSTVVQQVYRLIP